MNTLNAAFVYSALLLLSGLMFHEVRAWSMFGPRPSVLLESALRVLAMVFAARLIVTRLAPPVRAAKRLGTGVLALAFLLLAELTLYMAFRLSGIRYLPTRDPVALMVYVVTLGMSALMPLFVARGDRAGPSQQPGRRQLGQGVAYGLWEFQRPRPSPAPGPIIDDAALGDLLSFATGLFLACLLAALVIATGAWVASYVPGAVARSMMHDESISHALISASAGVVFCVMGWVCGVTFWRRGWRGLGAGMATGTTVLGFAILNSIPPPAGW